jgi:hypothetical protein
MYLFSVLTVKFEDDNLDVSVESEICMDAKIQYLKSILMKAKMVDPSKEDDPELAKILDEVLGMSNALGEVGGGGDKAGKTLLHDAAGDTTMNKE